MSPIPSRHAVLATNCHVPLSVDPRLGLLSAHDGCPDQWSSLVFCDLRAIAVSETKVGDHFDDWTAWGSDMIFRSVTWKTMLANAKPEDWWDDPSDNFGEDALECVDINRSRAALGFTVEQNTCPECNKFSKRKPKAIAIHRLRTHGHRKPLCCRNANECLVYPKCDKHFSFKSKLLDHAQYRSKSFRDKILSSQPIEA